MVRDAPADGCRRLPDAVKGGKNRGIERAFPADLCTEKEIPDSFDCSFPDAFESFSATFER